MSTGSCTVTPGTTFTATTNVTHTEQNLAAKPSVRVDENSIGTRELNRQELLTELGTGAAGVNYLANPNMAEVLWTRGSTAVTCPVGARTYRADDWFVTPAGAAVTYERAQAGPNYKSLHSAKITGDTGVTTVDFAQDIPRHISSALKTKLTLSFYLYNNTGAALTPQVRLDTCDSANNFNAVTNRFASSVATAAGNATWQLYEMDIDASAMTNLEHGLRVAIRLPSGALNSVSKSVNFTQLKLELGEEASVFVVPRDVEPSSSSGGAADVENFLDNGAFLESRWFSDSLTCTTGADNYALESWFVRPTGAPVISRTAGGPNTLTNNKVRVTGAAGTNEVRFGANIEAHAAASLRRNVIFSLYIFNNTGADIDTATLVLATPATANDFAAASVQQTVTLDPLADGDWTRVQYQVDASAIANLANGLRLYVEIPSGSLDAGAKWVEFAQALLNPGTAILDFVPRLETPEAAVLGATKNLVAVYASASTFTVNWDEAIVKDPGGRTRVAKLTGALTVDITASGANGLDTGAEANSTWYCVHAISNGAQHRALLSTSATAPVMPAGYNYRALIGAVYNDSSGNLIPFHQLGAVVWTTRRQAFNSTATAAATWQNLALTAFVPPTAKRFTGEISVQTAAQHRVGITASDAAAASKIAEQYLTCERTAGYTGVGFANTPFALPLIVAQQMAWQSFINTPTVAIHVTGFSLE